MHSSAICKSFWSKNPKQNRESTCNYLSLFLDAAAYFLKGACSFAQNKSTLLIAEFEAL